VRTCDYHLPSLRDMRLQMLLDDLRDARIDGRQILP
jgi:hypothetical protein